MDYDALERGLRFALRDWKGREDRYHFPSINALTIAEAADAIATLRARNEALVEALSKITPIVVHDGRDYAEVAFSDGRTHSSQAMTMNPQDWLDIQAAYDAALAANREG